MLRFQRLRSRIIFFFALLLVIVQGLAFFFVNAANSDNARHTIQQELGAGERLFQRLLENNRQQLAQSATVLAADFAFREAIATNDSATLVSVLKNHGARIRADAMMLASLDNRVLADTLYSDRRARPFPFTRLLETAREQGKSSAIVLIEGRPYQIVIVPVMAPLPIAWVVVGFLIDDQLARELRNFSGLQVSFLSKQEARPWTVLASTLADPLRDQLAEGLRNAVINDGRDFALPFSDGTYETRLSLLDNREGQVIAAVLQRSLDEALAAFDHSRMVLLVLGMLSLIVSMIGSFFIARGITRPLAQLTASALKMQQGDYAEPIVIARRDEVAQLAASLNHMREGISQREGEILRLAHEDTLTGLPNRNLFNERLQSSILLAKRKGVSLAVLIMDLDRFKHINDTLGHAVGDEVLKEVGARLKSLLRESDTIARLGGDEFGMLLPTAHLDKLNPLVRKILHTLEAPIVIDGQPLDVGASIGIASFPEHGEDPGMLIRRADVAMYVAKRANSGFATYDARYDDERQEHLSLLGELRRAVETDELRLYYQPKIDLALGRLAGVEALVRWNHPKRGLVPPLEFMPFAERTGYIRAITRWVLEAALRQCSVWLAKGIALPIAINISARDLLNPDLPGVVAALLGEQGVPAGLICLEITESSFMEDPAQALKTLNELDALGVRLSIDDYGTGYSSLAYLKKLPVDELKIDRTFVMGMTEDQDDLVIVRSTVELAHNLGLKVVAEGIESESCLDQLRKLGCNLAQGYFMSRPLPVEKLDAWLKESPWARSAPAPSIAGKVALKT